MTFYSISSIVYWAKSQVNYLGGSDLAPYVLKENLYHYFSFVDGQYVLFCTTERDLNYLEAK